MGPLLINTGSAADNYVVNNLVWTVYVQLLRILKYIEYYD